MATLRERIDADLKDAMRSKNELTLSVLRMLKSSIKYKEVEPGATGPLEDGAIQQVIATLIKQRRDSVEQYEKAGRAELADKERAEIGVIEEYLPRAASREEIELAVADAISELGATSMKEMGAVMKAAQARLAGRNADGRTVSEIVKAKLGG